MSSKRAMIENRLAFSLSLFLLAVLLAATDARAQGSEQVVRVKGYASVTAVRPGDKFRLAAVVEVEPGYHINAHVPSLDYLVPTEVEIVAPASIRIGEVKYPAPELRRFEFAPDTPLAVHEGSVIMTAEADATDAIKPGNLALPVKVQVQACNDSLCLAPATLSIEITLPVIASGKLVRPADGDVFAKADTQREASSELVQFQGGSRDDKNPVSELISSKGLVFALLFVFVSGLALNTTPCVYPIIPITIGFFVNQGAAEGKPRLRRTFLMASMYVVGMAVTYSVLGVIASLTKGLFGAAMQSPIVLVGLAGVMVALSLSMFGVYEFRLPESLNRFATRSTQSTSGSVGALVMGLTMGIVAAPCIGPFVLGLLVHVGAKGDPIYGFFMFFVLALGLGLPYLILGTFSGAIKALPRSGEWMIAVRKVFGVVLVGMALYFLMPLMGSYTTHVFVGFFAVSALYLIFFESGKAKPKQFAWALRAIGAGSAVAAVIIAMPKNTEAGIPWQPYSEQAVAAAREEGRAVIIDTFADWCIPCKELDQLTFTHSEVKKEAERFVALKLDLTTNNPDSEAGRARQRFDIIGVPTVIFLDPSGKERTDLRLTGFEKPAPFVARMRQIESPIAGTQSDGSVEAQAGLAALPARKLNLLDGSSLDLQSLNGRVVLVSFWATWCVPCLAEIPMFNQLYKTYRPRGFELVGISLDEEGAAKVRPFVKAHPMNYVKAIGDAMIAEQFKVSDSSLPVALVVDKQGRIRYSHVGLTKKELLEGEIEQLLSE